MSNATNPERGKITLGGNTYDVSGFTLDQLEALVPAYAALSRAGLTLAQSIGPLRQIVTAALAGQIGADELAELRTNVAELITAVSEIGRCTGLTAVGESPAVKASTTSTGSP